MTPQSVYTSEHWKVVKSVLTYQNQSLRIYWSGGSCCIVRYRASSGDMSVLLCYLFWRKEFTCNDFNYLDLSLIFTSRKTPLLHQSPPHSTHTFHDFQTSRALANRARPESSWDPHSLTLYRTPPVLDSYPPALQPVKVGELFMWSSLTGISVTGRNPDNMSLWGPRLSIVVALWTVIERRYEWNNLMAPLLTGRSGLQYNRSFSMNTAKEVDRVYSSDMFC